MTNMLETVNRSRVASAASDLASLASVYNVKLPPAHKVALQVAVEARRVAEQGSAFVVDLPTKADKTADTIRDIAHQRVVEREVATVAAEMVAAAEQEAARQAHSAIPDIYRAIAADFTSTRDDFEQLLETAPLEVTAATSPAAAAEHVALLGLVGRLTAAAQARLRIAQVLGENTKGQLTTWLLLDPKPEANISEVRAALASSADELPADLASWLRLLDLGCSMAHEDEAEARAQRFGQAVWHAGLTTPDGGRHDRTVAEAQALVPAPGANQ